MCSISNLIFKSWFNAVCNLDFVRFGGVLTIKEKFKSKNIYMYA